MNEDFSPKTELQYDKIINKCKNVFHAKTQDYGTAWRVLRTISIIDQIFIKAQRIRTIQENKEQRIGDNIEDELTGIVNYAVIGLIQLRLDVEAPEELGIDETVALYTTHLKAAKELMRNKNHDYGEAWRDMNQESFVDLIAMKIQRIRQIIKNDGKTVMSEGIEANYFDIINYAVFALILINEAGQYK
ncbi:MAG: DUF1599 domain-containing protein [Chitinophagaceae bacterium]